MNKPTHSYTLSFLALAMTLMASACLAQKKPNILFVFADDQCYETVGALGLTDIETPHLDRLMSQGTSFNRTYNMGSWSGAVCVASRHMLNTGRFIWKAETASKKAEDYSLNPTIISIFGAIFASIEKNEFNNKCNYKAL